MFPFKRANLSNLIDSLVPRGWCGGTVIAGTRIATRFPGPLLRPVTAEDGEALAAYFQEMSYRSRCQRFLGARHRVTAREIAQLCDVNQTTHRAWIVVLPGWRGDRIIAEARYVHDPSRAATGEFGLSVLDPYQGQGLGRQLMAVLGRHAAQQGLTALSGYTHSDNEPMLAYARHRGARITIDYPGVLAIDPAVAAITGDALAAARA